MEDTGKIIDKYRGPPPRKDLTPSPSKERDWKGNDWFSDMAAENGTHNGLSDERSCLSPTIEVGLPGLTGEYVDPHLKPTRDYESNYAKLAMQGGHKDLLSMNNEDSASPVVDDILGRRQKGCDNLSDYNKIALQGGHKNLLYIEDDSTDGKEVNVKLTTPTKSPSNRTAAGAPSKSEPNRQCGDWYSCQNTDNNNTPSPPKTISPPSKTAAHQRRGNGNVIVPESRSEEAPRLGKKRFDCQSQRHEAPFATYY